MNPTLDAVLRSWPFDPWLTFGLAATAIVYIRGWRILRHRDPVRWTHGKLIAFLGGLASIALALASPIEPFSAFFLQVHMLQHLLLMMAAPPLVWLGAPLFPMLRGLPRPIRTAWAIPLLRSPMLRDVFTRLTHPLTAWVIYVAVTWVWHVPTLYGLAMATPAWHYAQHVCFLAAALLFWYPVIRPYPARPAWSLWWLVPYLLLADVQNTVLSALLTFSSRVIYDHYAAVPRLGNMSALDDQAAAGVLMWVPGSVAFLAPLFWIGLRLMSSESAALRSARLRDPEVRTHFRGAKGDSGANRRIALPIATSSQPSNLLNVPLVGRFLRWRHARLCLQIPLLLLAVVVAVDGFTGPQVGAMNLAGVLPWIHWRGFLIFGLLALGNVFCLACPFMLPRRLGKNWGLANRNWPRPLRNKWLAVGLVAIFLWAYEAFALWDSPLFTAWIIAAYFLAAFIVDTLFRGAAFCKYVCPIGQFNFAQSLVSPLEIKVRDPNICETCTTKDCIRGRDGIPGCELRLYQPRKSSNVDCTFCLDCIHACPHDNIAVAAVMPGAELIRDPQRSGIGRFSRRRDLAALVVVLTFGAFVNAAMMTGPIVQWRDEVISAAECHPLDATTFLFVVGLGLVPVIVMGAAAALSRAAITRERRLIDIAVRFAFALVPLGFAMWLTHYSFHLLTSFTAFVPPTSRFFDSFGGADWIGTCCAPSAAWLLKLEITFLNSGMLGSLYVAHRIAGQWTATSPRSCAAFAPWAVLIAALWAIGIWIVFQPMEMRGTM